MILPNISNEKPRGRLPGIIESKEIKNGDSAAYRQRVQNHYDGLPGWFTLITGFFTGHEALAGRVIGPRGFNVNGCKRILDAGCGNGRYLRWLLRRADSDAELIGFDLSPGMLDRARKRLRSERPTLMTADLTRLPFQDESFDAVVCGWVLEHLSDPTPGLREMCRVLQPGGKLLLLTTETSLLGAICSRFYHCRTYRRPELRNACSLTGLDWRRELWWSRYHQALRRGGIVVELHREDSAT